MVRARKRASGDLVPRLFVELCQTEESARKHPRVEAKRLGRSPPGRAMQAVSDHAARILPEIRRLAKAEQLETRSSGAVIGDAFSLFRKLVFDQLLDREKSYRSTLIGMYHGMDVVRLLGAAARAEGRSRIVAFCERWLAERGPLVRVATIELEWFGRNPRLALEAARHRLGGKRKSA